MRKKYSLKIVKEVCDKFEIICLSKKYKNTTDPMYFKCKMCGIKWFSGFATIKGKKEKGCQKCASKISNQKRKYTLEYVKNFCENLKIECIATKYEDADTPITFKCRECDFEFDRKFTIVSNGHGLGCPKCNKRLSYTLEEVKECCKTKDIKCLSSEYERVNDFIDLECLICNYEWSAKFYSVNSGKGCPNCAGNLPLTQEYVENYCENAGIEVLSEYVKNKLPLEVRCKKCKHTWSPSFDNVKNNGTGCPKCAKKISKSENLLAELLINSNITNNFKISRNNRKIANPYEIDILFQNENHNIAVEYNGAPHYKPIYGEESLEKAQNNDKNKKEMLNELKYKFIIIKNEDSGFEPEKINDVASVILKLINKELNNSSLGFFTEIDISSSKGASQADL